MFGLAEVVKEMFHPCFPTCQTERVVEGVFHGNSCFLSLLFTAVTQVSGTRGFSVRLPDVRLCVEELTCSDTWLLCFTQCVIIFCHPQPTAKTRQFKRLTLRKYVWNIRVFFLWEYQQSKFHHAVVLYNVLKLINCCCLYFGS